jgi:hypothetical protein
MIPQSGEERNRFLIMLSVAEHASATPEGVKLLNEIEARYAVKIERFEICGATRTAFVDAQPLLLPSTPRNLLALPLKQAQVAEDAAKTMARIEASLQADR